MMKLNLGCGNNKIDGYLNVDIDPNCTPDLQADLEAIPWPFNDNSVEELFLIHVLEHLGETKEKYFGIIQEIYRIVCGGGKIRIVVPHPRHDHFVIDPTHVRAILPDQFYMFSKKQCYAWKQEGCANSNFADLLDVDFDILDIKWIADDFWLKKIKSGELTSEELVEKAKYQYNIVREIQIELRVLKP